MSTDQLEMFSDASGPVSEEGDKGLFSRLRQLVDANIIQEIDYYFPEFLRDSFGESNEATLKAAALITYANRQGHVGVDLSVYDDQTPLFSDREGGALPAPELKGEKDWVSKITGSKTVGDEAAETPMILEGSRLYLRKFWKYETELAEIILEKCRRSRSEILGNPENMPQTVCDIIAETVDDIFHETPSPYQQTACLTALLSSFSVITGGPGTGKTYTVLRLLALLLKLSEDETAAKPFKLPTRLRIAIAAPTGKAATRVRESILAGLDDLKIDEELKSRIPTEAQTIHRMLKSVHNSPHFRHNQENPLPYDVIIVDEASMVDLALMNKLVKATRPDARLVLLGDKDQLASVEAGAVLGDICRSDHLNRVSAEYAAFFKRCGMEGLEEQSADKAKLLRDAITELTESKRFGGDSGIGMLATQVNAMNVQQALSILSDQISQDISWSGKNALGSVMKPWMDHLEKLSAQDLSAEKAFEIIREKQILCAHRRGPYGSEDINRNIERAIRPESGRYATGEWYPGRIVMFTRNDYNLNVFNGDIGITLQDPDSDRLMVYVERPSNQDRGKGYEALSPAQAGECETAFAMSVHKSQGSEFNHVLLIMPEKPSPVITKELFYTALTRAKESFEVFGSKKVLQHAVAHNVRRTSGLARRLWEEEQE